MESCDPVNLQRGRRTIKVIIVPAAKVEPLQYTVYTLYNSSRVNWDEFFFDFVSFAVLRSSFAESGPRLLIETEIKWFRYTWSIVHPVAFLMPLLLIAIAPDLHVGHWVSDGLQSWW